tara:strand:+ start:102 stop:857 length:756 start_codon:yes stop_codon:yes gene_type:complete
MKDDKNKETYDDELISQIQNSINKVEIEYNDLPTNTISTIENSYTMQTFLSELHATGLGYELTYSDLDMDESSFKKIYFNLDGRKLISKRDGEKGKKNCFELVYPVSFIMPDGSNITISDAEDWEAIKVWYENNPNLEERPIIQYPVDIIYEDDDIITVNDENEMIVAKNSCIYCFELVYPVTFIMPDASTIIVENDNEEGWEELKNWYEDNSNSEERPTLQYPVDIILEDGSQDSINSDSEMETIKENCD